MLFITIVEHIRIRISIIVFQGYWAVLQPPKRFWTIETMGLVSVQ